jgi:glycosyltransferase involved in cell wall biosynthesis
LRILNLLRGLARCHEVTLLSFADQMKADTEAPELRAICREVHVVTSKPFNAGSAQARLGFMSPIPRSVVDTFSEEMRRTIRRVLSESKFDLVIASQIGTAIYGPYFQDLPALFEEVEVGVLYEQFARATSPWHRLRYGLTWAKHRRYLVRLLRHFRACTVVSERERQLFRNTAPGYKPIEVIPNGVSSADYAGYKAIPARESMIFTGSLTYSANYDAMVWFLGEVYPRIQAQVPNVHLTITGNHANRTLPTMQNVELVGVVDDVRPLIASAWLSLAPIRIGGGTRLKILEAMALCTPVVTTSKGAEGLNVRHDEHLLVADTPDAFTNAVVRLLKEPGLRQRLAESAHQVVRQKYDWQVILPHFLELVERVG